MALFTRCGLTNSTSPSCAASYPSTCLVRRCTTTHGPACSTVHPTSVPSVWKICVIPSLIPIIPLTAIASSLSFAACLCFWYWLRASQGAGLKPGHYKTLLCCCVTECFDLNVNARRKIELHQSVYRVRRRLENVDQTLVCAHFKLLARFLVHVRRPQNRPAIDRRGQRNRAGYFRAGALRC